MYRFYLAAVDMLPGALILVPVYLFLNRVYFHNTRKSIFYFIFSCYLSVVYVLVGMPNVTYIRPELNLNLFPIVGMIDDWKNSILNILLFIPLGTMLPILWYKFRTIKRTILFGLGVSITIELLQILTFRATDVNDLITNTLGAFLGFLCTQILLNRFPGLAHMAHEEDTSDLIIVLVIVLLVMFFLYPFVSSSLWNFILT